MSFNLDDPRLTEYALGEMAEADRIAFEKLLEQHPEARQEVAQIRAMADTLAVTLKDEVATERMSTRQRETVLDAADQEPARRVSSVFRPIAYLAAASVVFALAMFLYLHENAPKEMRVANVVSPVPNQEIPRPVETPPVAIPTPEPVTPQPPVVASGPVEPPAPVNKQEVGPAPKPQVESQVKPATPDPRTPPSPPAPKPKTKPQVTLPTPAPETPAPPPAMIPEPAPEPEVEVPNHLVSVPQEIPPKPDKPEKHGGRTELVPLEIDLPKPMFQGTPKNIKSDDLEANANQKRAPFMAPADLTNLAMGKTVTASDSEPIIGDLDMLTDGDKEASDGSFVEFGPGVQWVQIDLGREAEIFAVVFWHYHSQARVYKDVVVQISNDPDFVEGVKTIFNNDRDNSAGLGAGAPKCEYIETNEGKLVDAGGVTGRYVRLYSNGNTSNDMNHYIEIEVYGR